ncbi:MAG: 50S ribosomal protein L25 [Planctomycetota bacterium]
MTTTTDYPVLETQARTKLGTRYAKRVREAGRIPAVIYGHKQDPVHVSLHGKTFTELLHHEAHIIDVKVQGKSEHTLIKAIQWDTFGREIVHVDLERVDLSETIEVEVELQLTGEPAALRQAGTMLDHPTTAVLIRCRADSIPSHLEHSIAELAPSTPVTVGDLTPPQGVEVVSPPEQLVCQITGVKAADEEAEEGSEAEPEVINKGKDEPGE